MPRRGLVLARETLAELTPGDLASVVGARNSLLCVLPPPATFHHCLG